MKLVCLRWNRIVTSLENEWSDNSVHPPCGTPIHYYSRNSLMMKLNDMDLFLGSIFEDLTKGVKMLNVVKYYTLCQSFIKQLAALMTQYINLLWAQGGTWERIMNFARHLLKYQDIDQSILEENNVIFEIDDIFLYQSATPPKLFETRFVTNEAVIQFGKNALKYFNRASYRRPRLPKLNTLP